MGKTLERLQKAVVDTEAAYDYAVFMFMGAGYDSNYMEDTACSATYTTWAKARLKLSDYLKEHGDD